MEKTVFLSKKEKEIICLIWEELSRSEISNVLKISEHTVDWYINKIYKKLNLRRNNQIGLVKYALNQRIIFLKKD